MTLSTEPPVPHPHYVTVTVIILKRCLNYVASSNRDNCILALQVLNTGFPILRDYENELLPLVHLTWGPLVSKFEAEPAIMKRAFDLLVTMAELSKDFIQSRAVKWVLLMFVYVIHCWGVIRRKNSKKIFFLILRYFYSHNQLTRPKLFCHIQKKWSKKKIMISSSLSFKDMKSRCWSIFRLTRYAHEIS